MTVYVSIAGDCTEPGKKLKSSSTGVCMHYDTFIQWNTTEKMKINMGEFQKCYIEGKKQIGKQMEHNHILKVQQ